MLNQSIPVVQPNQLQEIDADENHLWKSCCFELDRHATVFFSQLIVCILVISFCMYQLLHSKSCETDQLYSSILTLVLGVLIPSPRVHKT